LSPDCRANQQKTCFRQLIEALFRSREARPLHREYRPEQMRLGSPSAPHGHDEHGPEHDHHDGGQGHHHHVERPHDHGHSHDHDHDHDAERRWLWAATAAVGLLRLADLVLAAVGNPWRCLAIEPGESVGSAMTG
jgi:ABC-type nickel/cobalt efflux system permease component RcnA